MGPRACRVRALLEVGLGGALAFDGMGMGYPPGSSLKAWRRIFPLSNITGLDIDEDAVKVAHGTRFQSFMCDSQNATQARRALKGKLFDIIIDDGLHTINSQKATARALWPYLRQGGLYVIEDASEWLGAYYDLTLAIQHAVAVCTKSNRVDWMVITVKTSEERPFRR